MLCKREYQIDDISSIEMNDYARNHVKERFYAMYLLNDMEALTVYDDKDGKIHAIMFIGKYRYEDWWYGWTIYAKDCSKMIVRVVRKTLDEYVKKGYNIRTVNDDESLTKFHDVIFREYE